MRMSGECTGKITATGFIQERGTSQSLAALVEYVSQFLRFQDELHHASHTHQDATNP